MNSIMNIGEYMKFCKDFDIKISKPKITEIFKKFATNSIEMTFSQFKLSIPRLWVELGAEEITLLQKRL